jgi:hypothetical protein
VFVVTHQRNRVFLEVETAAEEAASKAKKNSKEEKKKGEGAREIVTKTQERRSLQRHCHVV